MTKLSRVFTRHQAKLLDQEDERRVRPRRRRDRIDAAKLLRWWIAGLTFIFVAVAVQTCGIRENTQRLDRQQHALDRQQHVLYKAQVGSCERVNRLRSNDNKNAAIQFETILLAERLVKGSPIKAVFHRLASIVDVIPATDCTKAVGTPALYQPPERVPLYKLSGKERLALERTGVFGR